MEILYSERQRFRQWWLILLISLPTLFFCVMAVSQFFFGIVLGKNPMTNVELIIAFVVNAGLLLLFFSASLHTRIEKDAIRIRFFPFHFSYRSYLKDEITNAFVREYKPIAEYGGWGIRGLGKNRAFNVSGNKGLQLEFIDGRRILIGTSNPEEMKAAVSRFLNKHEN